MKQFTKDQLTAVATFVMENGARYHEANGFRSDINYTDVHGVKTVDLGRVNASPFVTVVVDNGSVSKFIVDEKEVAVLDAYTALYVRKYLEHIEALETIRTA